MNEKKETQWITMENFKIYSGGLWEVTEPENPLSELIEVAKLDYIGSEDGIGMYVCNEPPKSFKDLMKFDTDMDTHLYLGVWPADRDQKAMLWPY